MSSQFLLVLRSDGENHLEVLVNIASIWKIEVRYVKPTGAPDEFGEVPRKYAVVDADATRLYRLYFGGDSIEVRGGRTQ